MSRKSETGSQKQEGSWKAQNIRKGFESDSGGTLGLEGQSLGKKLLCQEEQEETVT